MRPANPSVINYPAVPVMLRSRASRQLLDPKSQVSTHGRRPLWLCMAASLRSQPFLPMATPAPHPAATLIRSRRPIRRLLSTTPRSAGSRRNPSRPAPSTSTTERGALLPISHASLARRGEVSEAPLEPRGEGLVAESLSPPPSLATAPSAAPISISTQVHRSA